MLITRVSVFGEGICSGCSRKVGIEMVCAEMCLEEHHICFSDNWGFLGIPVIRIIIYWDLLWGPLFYRNYHTVGKLPADDQAVFCIVSHCSYNLVCLLLCLLRAFCNRLACRLLPWGLCKILGAYETD